MFQAPVEEIAFVLRHVVGLEAAMRDGVFPELDADLLEAILSEAGRFAGEEIAPLSDAAERAGAKLTGKGEVALPPGFAALYRAWAAAGWNGLSSPTDFGGQGLPHVLNVAAMEVWNGASMAFALCPMLTQGAINAIAAHGASEQKALYLPKLVSGEWTATMNLTEPQAGSDLAALRTKAERAGDGSYRIFGQKIYITFGEHDAAENIVHLVLARLPDSPAGTRGISLFLVPKYLPDETGAPGRRNDLFCHAIEHKLGIHASPTCTMIYGEGEGATGFLLGEENKGLACMFTMMNDARLAVGIQGVGVAEAATQKALAYARERRQGRAPGDGATDAGAPDAGMSPILAHPDVARMVLTMQALTQGARALCYACAMAVDLSHRLPEAAFWSERAALLTPIAKGFSTEIGVDVAGLGIQVHGGMGFIEETGAARLWRDARIAPIYEGTNGIQAIDLVMRKLPLSGSRAAEALLADIEATIAALDGDAALAAALADLRAASAFLLQAHAETRVAAVLAGASAYQRLFGLVLCGHFLARAALADSPDAPRRMSLYRFFADALLPETAGLARSIQNGADSLAAAAAHLKEA